MTQKDKAQLFVKGMKSDIEHLENSIEALPNLDLTQQIKMFIDGRNGLISKIQQLRDIAKDEKANN